MALTQVKAEGIATGAVTTTKLEDDAVSNAKLTSSTNQANRAVGADTVQDDAIGIAALSATGTASSSTFLRGDNSWVTPTDTNTQLAFANDANNRVVTGTGSGLNGEANLTFDGSSLGIGANGAITTGSNFSLNGNALTVTGSAGTVIEGKRAGSSTIQVTNTSDSTDLQLRADATGGLVRTATNKPLLFGTNQTERMRIDSSGDLHFRNATTSAQGLKWYKDSNLGVSFTYGEGTANPTLNIYRQDSQSGFPYGNLIINTGDATTPTQALKLRTDKHIELAGSLIMANGQGIDFSATSHATGKTSEVLDNYEEGTFTPYVQRYQNALSALSMSRQYGSYTRIGNFVYAQFDIIVSSWSGGSGAWRINGFPFPALTGSNAGGYGAVQFRSHDFCSSAFRERANSSYMDGSACYLSYFNSSYNEVPETSANGSGRLTGFATYFV